MKKIVCLLLMIIVLPFQFTGCTGDATAALAETDNYSYDIGLPQDGRGPAEGRSQAIVAPGEKSASGTVEAVDSHTISAPFGGLLEYLDVRRGDDVSKDDVLFELNTVKVYSPRDGSVTAVRTVSGDYAQTVQARYGALCYIEPDPGLVVNAAVTGAYNKAENKTIHAGELLYVKNSLNARFTGEGGVIGVNRDKFSVELERGSLQNGDTVSLFRKEDYSAESRVGTGKVSRIDPVPVTSQGSVLKVHVSEGQKVKKGDLLFEMVGGDLTGYGKENADNSSDRETASINDIDNTIKAGRDGVLGDIFVAAGQPVQKDQPLAKLYAKSDMVVIAEVDEIDIGSLDEGDDVTIVFDGIPGKSFEGNIETISGLGIKKQNAGYFDVRISFEPDPKVRLGMSATVYFED
ncbi:MAG TPA: HlyD family efflux transporter periplasmic adaptor subunit [Clostridia bacterium]|nr:HlyD family efflux transporter periplasmic adaptor subunit [Clostridia bacterium]